MEYIPQSAFGPFYACRLMDRLADLRQGLELGDSSVIDLQDATPSVDPFFHLVLGVQSGLQNITANTANIRELHARALRSSDSNETGNINAQLQQHMTTVNAISEEIKQALLRMEASAQQAVNEPATYRMRQQQYVQLNKAYVGEMRGYHATLAESKSRYTDVVSRRIRTRMAAEGSPVDEESAQQLAAQCLRHGTQGQLFMKSRDTLIQIEENHRDYVRLEAAMHDLLTLFQDFSVLVEQQGSQIEDIMMNVQAATEFVRSGTDAARDAKKYQKKARNKTMYLLLVTAIIAFILILGGGGFGTIFAVTRKSKSPVAAPA